MRRALKYLFAFIGIVVVVIVAAALLIPRERIVALAADQVRAATGRELVLTGDISPSFWPVLGVRTGPVTLSNADWAEAPEMISAAAAEIGVELMPLISGEIKVTTLRLVDPVVALEIDRDGRANWIFDDGSVPQGGTSSGTSSGGSARELPKISLPEAVISNGRISFRDARSGQTIELAALDLTAGLEGLDKPLSLEGSGLWNGKRATVNAFIDTPAAAMDGRTTAVRVSLVSDPANFSFDGDLQLVEGAAVPLVNGEISANLPNPSAATAWATGAGAPAGLADLGAVKLDGSLSATDAALKVSAAGSVGFKGRAVGFDLEADGGDGWLDRQEFTVVASGRSEGLFQFSFRGPIAIGDVLAADGPLKLSVSDPRGMAKWIGDTALDAPAGMLESASLESRLALQGGDRIKFEDLTLRLDKTTMTGDAGVALGGARPMITANLNSTPLDLSPFMAPGGNGAGNGGGGGGGDSGQGWSTEPLDLSALRAVDADVAIRAEAVDLGDIEIGRSDIAARLRNGKLDLKIDRVDAYGGGMTGTVVVVAGDEAALSTDLTISSVQMRPLLNALAGFDSLEGLGAFRVNVNGRGRSMDGLMKSLDGQGGLDLTDGAILGLDLAAMVRNLTGGGNGGKTDFSAVTGTFDITNGVLHNTDFSFLGPLLRVIGSGTVDIGRQAQNFRLEPTAVASLTGQGGSLGDAGLGIFPILVTGTWSNPSFRPDLTSAIEGLLSDPTKTLDAVTGLINGADPGKAAGSLLGVITGGAGDGGTDSTAGTLGDVLGNVLGGGSTGQTQDTGSGGGVASGLGGLLGALGGSSGGASSGSETLAQPTNSNEQSAIDASDLAPVSAPVPAPANRDLLSALPDPAPSLDGTAPAESLTVPSPTFMPETVPQTTETTAPESETVLQPQAEPQPSVETSTTEEVEAQGRRKKERKLKPIDILKGILK